MASSSDAQVISEAINRLFGENEELRETLSDVSLMLQAEDRNWDLLGSYLTGDKMEGFDLKELKEVSDKLRKYTTGNALMRRGCALHTGYVFSNGFFIEGSESPQGSGRPSKLRQTFVNQVNQESIFSSAAQAELQKARYTDGNVFLAVNKSKSQVRRIPLSEITGIRIDEDFGEDVIAYQRTWTSGSSVKKVWYMTDRFNGNVPSVFDENSDEVPVDASVRIIDGRFNRAVGYVLGVPDAIAASVYVSAYDQILQYGRVVDESLSRILYKVVNKTKQGVQSSGVKMSNMTGHGNTATMTEGQDLQVLSGSRTNFDFTNARPIAAMAAAALDVSNVDFTADSAAAGSSYGAGQLLTAGVRNAMKQKQNEWMDIFHRVFTEMGLGRPRIFFEKMETVEPYRAAQALTLLSPTLHDEEYRMKSLDILDVIGNSSDIPESLKQRVQANAAAQQSAPDQGRSSGTGTGNNDSGGSGANDLRTDSIANENLRHEMAMSDLIAQFSEVAVRIENAQK